MDRYARVCGISDVLATFCMQTMMPLRLTAILSNILFASFGLWAHIYPVMILHLILFPVNALRLLQIRRLVRGTFIRKGGAG